MLSHVLLPAGLGINLSFCHYGMLAVVNDAFFGTREQRPTAGVRLDAATQKPRQISLTPGAHSYDGSYTCVNLELGEVVVTVESARANEDDLVVLVKTTQPEYRAPAMVMDAAFFWNRQGFVRHDDKRSLRAEWPTGRRTIHCTRDTEEDPNIGY